MVMKNNSNDYTKDMAGIVKENNTLFISTMKDKLLTITNPDLREKIQNDMTKNSHFWFADFFSGGVSKLFSIENSIETNVSNYSQN